MSAVKFIYCVSFIYLEKQLFNINPQLYLYRVDIKANFSLRIWVAVSQNFELIDILRKILEQIRAIDLSEQGKDEEYFLAKLHKSLVGKKYLLVLDDVWTDELWIHIEEALVEANNGSRVLVTSRDKNVAKSADPSLDPYILSLLCEEEGLQLLLKKARYNPDLTNNYCSSDLIYIAKQLVKKCCGLPLALVILGGLLSRKSPEYTEWNKLLQTLSWRTDGSRCTKVLATSYEHLPLSLKFCFMYFAAFPEDCNIYAEELIRMWIAEGFIPQEENRTLEDTAERFLEDLVQRYDALLALLNHVNLVSS
jgi:NB-ARC domain